MQSIRINERRKIIIIVTAERNRITENTSPHYLLQLKTDPYIESVKCVLSQKKKKKQRTNHETFFHFTHWTLPVDLGWIGRPTNRQHYKLIAIIFLTFGTIMRSVFCASACRWCYTVMKALILYCISLAHAFQKENKKAKENKNYYFK